jgi:hypothetical protein
MPNNPRRTAPGAITKPTPVQKARPAQPPRSIQPPPPRPQVQLKQSPATHAHNRAKQAQNRGAIPHINQHAAHLQRTVQMKMKQTRGANRVVSPAHARTSGVVQPACIGDFFSGIWQSLSSCWSTPRRDQYEEIPDRGTELGRTQTPRVQPRSLPIKMVDQEQKIKNVAYPASVNAVYIAGCALVIFCGADTFDCYHPSGGIYKAGHGLRGNPTRIYYVYRSLPTDSSSIIDDYQRSARFYQADGGRAPLTVLGQRGVKANIWVDVISEREIGPNMGSFI